MIYIMPQSDIIEELSVRASVSGDSPWNTKQMYAGINGALRTWNRVRIPYIYTISGGWSGNSYTVALPSYMDHNYVRPQILSTVTHPYVEFGDNALTTWIDLPGWLTEPDGSGGWTLRLTGLPYAEQGRIMFWMNPLPVPPMADGEFPTITGDITSASTSVTISTPHRQIPQVGYILIEGEWLQYAGIEGNAGESTWTLSNLTHAVLNTTNVSQSHSSGAEVEWGVPADDVSLYEILLTKAESILHRMFLTSGAPNEKEDHKWAMRYLDAEVAEAWKGYSPSWQPKLLLNTGDLLTGLEM